MEKIIYKKCSICGKSLKAVCEDDVVNGDVCECDSAICCECLKDKRARRFFSYDQDGIIFECLDCGLCECKWGDNGYLFIMNLTNKIYRKTKLFKNLHKFINDPKLWFSIQRYVKTKTIISLKLNIIKLKFISLFSKRYKNAYKKLIRNNKDRIKKEKEKIKEKEWLEYIE